MRLWSFHCELASPVECWVLARFISDKRNGVMFYEVANDDAAGVFIRYWAPFPRHSQLLETAVGVLKPCTLPLR
jgi:hypothetical protein